MAQSKSRYAPHQGEAPAGRPWLAFLLVALGGAAAGVIGTYLILLPRLPNPANLVAPATGGAAPVLAAPPPELTAGVPPPQADRNLGNFYYDQSDWPQAIRYYESALRQGADDADLHTDLGNAYQFAGRANVALAQYTIAQRLNPNHEFSLFNQGGLFMERLNQPDKAVAVWNEYLRRFPEGRNVEAAKALIAQAQSRATGLPVTAPVPAASANPAPQAPDNTDVERLLHLVPPAPPAKR